MICHLIHHVLLLHMSHQCRAASIRVRLVVLTDVLTLETPCVLQVSGWPADDSFDVRSPVAKSQLEKSVVVDPIKDSLVPRVRPNVSLYMPENLKKMPQPLKLKGRRRFRKTLKKSKIGTRKMNDTTTRITETCHSVLTTHIETKLEQKLIKILI